MVSPLTVFTVVGARPQFVKAAMVSRLLNQQNITEILVHTGQHFDADMSAVFFHELPILTPTYQLELGGLAQGAMTGRMLEQLEALMMKHRPDWVLVYGDTNSTLAAALAASKLQIPIAHVEAGMRSFNRSMPEEINRVLVDHVSTLLFAPSQQSVNLLQKEGIERGVHCVGDIMLDAVLFFQERLQPAVQPLFEQWQLQPKSYFLMTLHRAENTNDPQLLQHWLNQIMDLSKHHKIVFPMHPRTKKAIENFKLAWEPQNIHVCSPLPYFQTLGLLAGARLLLTDSGGMQKEAYYLQTPCLTLRTETEWVETLGAGWNRLVTSPADLAQGIQDALTSDLPPTEAIYGDGQTAQAIVRYLCA